MRLRFGDIINLKKIAKYEVKKGIGRLKTWWSRKYKLPPNHKLFVSRSVGALYLEMYIDMYVRREDLMRDIEDETLGFKAIGIMTKELEDLNNFLGEESEGFGDPLIDKWEKELEEGKIPDLNEGLSNA